ncbi:hypothetical protein DFH27DRAFT_557968 [Peziza echinospora]|nr:hypothetical protein DFH27DRAFT_557968 [Peziza echinospora]
MCWASASLPRRTRPDSRRWPPSCPLNHGSGAPLSNSRIAACSPTDPGPNSKSDTGDSRPARKSHMQLARAACTVAHGTAHGGLARPLDLRGLSACEAISSQPRPIECSSTLPLKLGTRLPLKVGLIDRALPWTSPITVRLLEDPWLEGRPGPMGAAGPWIGGWSEASSTGKRTVSGGMEGNHGTINRTVSGAGERTVCGVVEGIDRSIKRTVSGRGWG